MEQNKTCFISSYLIYLVLFFHIKVNTVNNKRREVDPIKEGSRVYSVAFVHKDEWSSENYKISCGVPQGSSLGCPPFNLYCAQLLGKLYFGGLF